MSDFQEGYTASDIQTEAKEKDYTMVFCRRTSNEGQREILLGMKKYGFGIGKWGGFGGKLELGETIEQAAIRELWEECGVVAKSLQRLGYMVFNMLETGSIMRFHVYVTWDFENEAAESEEMKPMWYREDEIPFRSMWADDEYWFPYLLQEKPFICR
jgi:8-oxo-dGTP diphosphatase/2-hydroxy-dATP diphosphatase